MKKKIIIIVPVFIIIILLLINYLVVNSITIEMIGQSKISLNVDDEWIDPGCNINNNSYKDKLHVTSNLDLSKQGIYRVEYSIKIGLFSKKVEREVEVLSKGKNSDIRLAIIGENPLYLMNGKDYVEQGITAYDIYDGNLNDKITINNNINNQVNGDYEVIYEVHNSNGITKKIKRTVIVYSFEFNGQLKYTEYNIDNEILINISDKQYKYTILPNNSKSLERDITYQVKENGIYSFTFYDKNDNKFIYEVNVSNIDTEAPTGTCTLSLNDHGGTITVDASDNNEIKGYVYNYGKTNTELSTNNNYVINTLDDTASVIIYDKANNKKDIICKTVDNSTKIASGYNLLKYQYNGKTYQYWFYTPENNTARKKMPLVTYLHGDGGRTNANNINKYALPKYIAAGHDYPFFMIAPYCDNTADFSQDVYMAFIINLIDYISANYNIDTNRLIMSGGSSGARGAYAITANNKRFSALVIISGITYQLYSSREQNLTYLPIWVFHGKNDQQVGYNDVKYHVDNINSYGGNVLLTAYDGGHNSTDQAFESQEVINWMITQKRK